MVSRSTTPFLILCVQVSLSTLGRVVSQPHVTIVRHFVHRFSLSTLGGVVSYYYFLHLGSSTSILFSSIHQYPVGPSSSTIPRKFNSDERKAADKVLRSQIRTARFFQRQARIERIRAEERTRALAAELAERGRQRDQQRQQLPVSVPPIAQRRYSFLPPSVSRPPEPIVPPATPPDHPESEDDDFVPSLSHPDCKVIDEVSPSSSEGEAPPPPPVATRPSARVVRIRNKKTNTTRYADLDQLFRPGPQDRIVRHKLN